MASNFDTSSQSFPAPPPPPRPPPPPLQPEAECGGTISAPPGSGMGPIKNNGSETSQVAAADLIRTLDSAFAEMNLLSSSAAKDVEDARRNARAASEVARRYTTRTFPQALAIPLPLAGSKLQENISRPLSSLSKKQKYQESKAIIKSGITAERLAESHVEDVLTLSLELERTKQELELERQEHDQTRMSSTLNRAKNCELEAQMEKVLADLEKQREDHGRLVDRLKEEVFRSKVRLEAAEEDAQVALDLAKDSASSREELEAMLEKALEENTLLRNQLEQVGVPPGSVMPTTTLRSKKNSVRFAESPTIFTLPGQSDKMTLSAIHPQLPPPSRAMVNAGRNLFVRSSAPGKAYTIRMTPKKSAERRQRLRDRLKALSSESLVFTPVKTHGFAAGNQNEAYGSVYKIICDSAVRLHLVGRWEISTIENSSNLASLTRRFCSSVETKVKLQTIQINEQLVQIKDLSVLCGYLEDRLSLSIDNNNK